MRSPSLESKERMYSKKRFEIPRLSVWNVNNGHMRDEKNHSYYRSQSRAVGSGRKGCIPSRDISS